MASPGSNYPPTATSAHVHTLLARHTRPAITISWIVFTDNWLAQNIDYAVLLAMLQERIYHHHQYGTCPGDGFCIANEEWNKRGQKNHRWTFKLPVRSYFWFLFFFLRNAPCPRVTITLRASHLIWKWFHFKLIIQRGPDDDKIASLTSVSLSLLSLQTSNVYPRVHHRHGVSRVEDICVVEGSDEHATLINCEGEISSY